MKIFIASFNRASDGALSLLKEKLAKQNMLTSNFMAANYILACGDREETFDFVLKRFRENKKIIHLWAGEISQATHDEVYRHAMTIMSVMQLCTNPKAKKRVRALCRAVDKEPNAFVVGNVMLDNLKTDKNYRNKYPKGKYDLILYNPPTMLSFEEVRNEIDKIFSILKRPYIWCPPNGDKYSDLVEPLVTHQNLSRPQFLRLLKDCRRFISNSSCVFYEAQFLLKPHQIIQIGQRNKDRESKYSNLAIKNASDNIIKVLKGGR